MGCKDNIPGVLKKHIEIHFKIKFSVNIFSFNCDAVAGILDLSHVWF